MPSLLGRNSTQLAVFNIKLSCLVKNHKQSFLIVKNKEFPVRRTNICSHCWHCQWIHLRQVVWRCRQKVSECSTPMTGGLEVQTKGQWVQYTYDRWSGDADKRSVSAVHLWQVVWRCRQKVSECSTPTTGGLEMQTKKSVSAVHLWQVVWRCRQKVSECSTPTTSGLEMQTKGQWVQYTYDR